MITSPAFLMAPLVAVWTAANACHGFATSKGSLSRFLPVLRYQEDGPLVVTESETPIVIAPVLDAVAPLAPLYALDEEDAVITAKESLRPLTFADDIEDFLDITRPYYSLTNEHAIVDETGEMVGIVCTAKSEMPAGRESGVPCAETGRHMAAAGTVAALLRNPQKKR